MASKNKSRLFPYYLKEGVSKPALAWLGKRLRDLRGKRTVEEIATRAGMLSLEPESIINEIKTMERGDFHLNVGRLRKIVHYGYQISFEDLLFECCSKNGSVINSSIGQFHRDLCYEVRREGTTATPFLIGGDPQRYLWAVPFRKLKAQPLVTELLELAPLRKKPDSRSGALSQDSHDGVEVVHVIFGAVTVHLNPIDGGPSPTMKATESIHFHSRYPHHLENNDHNNSTLLLIVRFPQPCTDTKSG